MKNLKKILLAAGIATSLLAGQTSNQAKAQNYDIYSHLEKTHDSLMAKVKYFVRMTQSEVNSCKAGTEYYTRGLNLVHKSSVKSYIGRCQKDSAYVKLILDRADSLKLFLEAHIQRVENTLTINFKRSRDDYYKEVAELKAAKNTLSNQVKQQRKLSLEKINKKLNEDETLLKALKDQSESYLIGLKDYINKIPNSTLEIYVSELKKSRKLLASFEAEEKKEQEKAERK